MEIKDNKLVLDISEGMEVDVEKSDLKAGINASLMRQYAMGIHEPSKKRKQQILDCLHGISKELQAVVI